MSIDDIGGVAYDTLNTGDAEVDAYNIPYMIATDLSPRDYILTLTKVDSSVVSIQGSVMFYDEIKVSASVTGCYIVVGGQ